MARLISFLLIISSSQVALSAEGGEGAEAGKPEAGKAEAGKAEVRVEADGKSCRYSEHESRLTSLTAKIRSYEGEITELIEAKHHVENSERVRQVTQQITFKHDDLRRAIHEYETLRLHVRFQHPDRGSEDRREYPRQRLKSIEELDRVFGLDGRLDRIKTAIGKVFPIPTEESAKATRGVASENSDDDKIERILLKK